MKTHINNNKNIKKIIRFCLYSITAFPATNLICAEKNSQTNSTLNKRFAFLNVLLNPQNDIELPSQSELLEKYFINNNVEKQPLSTPMNMNVIRTYYFPANLDDNKQIELHKSTQKSIKETKIKDEYIKINFSSIDTMQKYNVLARELPEGKKTFVTVACSKNGCNSKMTGLLSVARCSMRSHISKHHSTQKKLNKKINTESTSKNIEPIKINFSSIDTIEKYNTLSAKLPEGKKTLVIIQCNQCQRKRTGPIRVARAHINAHIKKDHLTNAYN